MEKAKYIQEKEKTMFSDLSKSYQKMKEVANWYSLSNYETNTLDRKNIKLYIEKVNNIYHELRNFLINTQNFNLLKECESLIIEEKLDLIGIEKKLIDNKNKEQKLEVSYTGKVVCENRKDNVWSLENEQGSLSPHILDGIDELLTLNNLPILEDKEEIEITIKFKTR